MKINRRKIVSYLFALYAFFICFIIFDHQVIAQQDAQTYYQNGYQYFSQGQYEKAQENYQKAIDLNPNFEDAHYWLGKVFRQIGQHDKAVTQWIEVLRINPRNPYAFRYLNESFLDTSRVRESSATQHLQEGKRILNRSDEDYFIDEGSIHSLTLLQSVPYFKRAIQLQESLIESHYWLGQVYQALSKKISWQYTSMAISSFEKVIQMDENLQTVLYQPPTVFWFAYQELIGIYKSLGLNERRENLLNQMNQFKAKPYNHLLTEAGYEEYGYPDQIEIIADQDGLIELWKYEAIGKIFKIVDKKIVGEEVMITESSGLIE